MLEDQFIIRLILIAFFGIVYIYTMTKMASCNSAETTIQKHVVFKIIGSICLLLSTLNLIWGIYLLTQIQYPEQTNIFGFNEPVGTNGHPTYEQNQIMTCITNVFSSLAWASYCFFFKKSNRKLWTKILIFINGVLLYALYCSSTRFQDFGIKEMFVICLFYLIAVLCVVLPKNQDKHQETAGINNMQDQKVDNENESKKDDNWFMTRQDDGMKCDSKEDERRFMPHQYDAMESESKEDNSRFMPHQYDAMDSSPRNSTKSENEEEPVNDFPDFTDCEDKHIEVQEATNNYNNLPKYCRHCGKEVDYTNSIYCKYCGRKLKP